MTNFARKVRKGGAMKIIGKMVFVFFVCILAVTGILIFDSALKAEDSATQVPVNNDSKHPVAIETKNGDTFVVYILKETKDDLLVQNLNDTIEGIVLRSEIIGIREPTAEEIKKTKERLGIMPKEASS